MNSDADHGLGHELRFWYDNWIEPVEHLDREPHPATCPTCEKPKLPRSTSDTVCTVCRRFKRFIAVPSSFAYCSCACTCVQAPANGQNDEDDSADEDYRPDSSHSTDSRVTNSNLVGDAEAHALSSGLSAMELHDLHVEGFSREEIHRRFPEARNVHRQTSGTPVDPDDDDESLEGPNDELSQTQCRICNHMVMGEMQAALEGGRIQECMDCERPRYRADPSLLLSEAEMDACLCRCDCEIDPDIDMGNPGYLPFISNRIDYTPRPWLQRWLERQGFCNINSQTQRWQNQVVSGTFLPTFRSIMDRSHATEVEATNNSIRLFAEDQSFAIFPNGVERDLNTASGLPAALQSVLRSIDPDAFAEMRDQELRRLSQRAITDIDSIPSDQWYAVSRYRYFTIYEAAALRHGRENFLVWFLIHEDDFADNESNCTADDHDFTRDEYVASLSDEERRSHRRRHINRRFEDAARQGGYYTNSFTIRQAAALEDEFQLDWNTEPDDTDDTDSLAFPDAADQERYVAEAASLLLEDTEMQGVAGRFRQNRAEVPEVLGRLITQLQQIADSTPLTPTHVNQQQPRTIHSENDVDHETSDPAFDGESNSEPDNISQEGRSNAASLEQDDEVSDEASEVTPAFAIMREMFLSSLLTRIGYQETEGLQVQLHDETTDRPMAQGGEELQLVSVDHRNDIPPVPLVEVWMRYGPAPVQEATHDPAADDDPAADEQHHPQQEPESES